MLILKASPASPSYQFILDKLDELSLAKKLIEIKPTEEISLQEGGKIYKGELAILDHLEKLEKIVEKWYDCHC